MGLVHASNGVRVHAEDANAVSMDGNSVIYALLERCREGATVFNKQGKLPLHIALECQAPLEVVAALLNAAQDAALMACISTSMIVAGVTGEKAVAINGVYELTDEIVGGLPVYRKQDVADMWLEYCVSSKQWQIKSTPDRSKDASWAYCVDTLPTSAPDKCSGEGTWHVVADNDAFVLQPQVTCFCDGGKYALHFAAACCSSVQVVELVLNAFPDAVRHVDRNGSLPLHLALKKSAPSVEMMQMLYDAYHDGALVVDVQNRPPLQLALEGKASFEVVELLLTLAPEAALINNVRGENALHCALKHDASLRVITALLNVSNNISLSRRADIKGQLALHIAVGKVDSASALDEYLAKFLLNEQELVEKARLLDMFKTGRFQFYASTLTSTTLVFSAILTILIALTTGFWDGLQDAMEQHGCGESFEVQYKTMMNMSLVASFFSLLCIAVSTFQSGFVSQSTLNKERFESLHDVLELKSFEAVEIRASILFQLFFSCYEISVTLLFVIIWKLVSYFSIPTKKFCEFPNDDTFSALGIFVLGYLVVTFVENIYIQSHPGLKGSRLIIENSSSSKEEILEQKKWAKKELERIGIFTLVEVKKVVVSAVVAVFFYYVTHGSIYHRLD